MIKFKINGIFQYDQACDIAVAVPDVNVRRTFVEMPDEQAPDFAAVLRIRLNEASGDRGRLNALHSVRRHFEAATSDRG